MKDVKLLSIVDATVMILVGKMVMVDQISALQYRCSHPRALSTKSGERLSHLCVRQRPPSKSDEQLDLGIGVFPGLMHSDGRPFHPKTHRSNYYNLVYSAQPLCMLGFQEASVHGWTINGVVSGIVEQPFQYIVFLICWQGKISTCKANR